MKVKDLINQLQLFDDDDIVLLDLDDPRISCDIYDLYLDPIKMDNGKFDVYLRAEI